ncbi:hypothetical protein OEZ85_006752 [Tetradesmus obliquus]|uniref:Uncharacterized protein n=1 Tax=Tetradesmus obliquus TaxID=3088 RepID=A0ABY8TW17_TETOB|nr:hypothetical protein OEZ85_006752 [Tetradesmus obliquus]
MGINLRLGVGSLQEMASSSGPIPVDGGGRCGNEGGLKRCCKQHRAALMLLQDQQGRPLPGAAHLDGLASMLKVSHVELPDSISRSPLQEYLQLPPVPSWRTCPQRSSLQIGLPPSLSCKGCKGLDFVVALQQDTTHSIGSLLPVVSVLKCSNTAAAKLANRLACRKHQGGLLHIVAQGAAAPFQECSNLGELAVWLGVGKVEVYCRESSQPIQLGAYPLLAVQRCGNEAGSRTRCRAHISAPITLLAACAPPQAAAAAPAAAAAAAAAAAGQAAGRREQPQLTVLAKTDSNAKLAHMLGLQRVVLQDKDTRERLGDVSEWSASMVDGKAAKLTHAADAAADAAAGATAAALAAAGMPLSLAAALTKAAAEERGQLASRAASAGALLQVKAAQKQQQGGQVMHRDTDAEAAASASGTAGTAGAVTMCDDAVPEAEPVLLPDALPGSTTDAAISLDSCSMPGSTAACSSPLGGTPADATTADEAAADGAERPAANPLGVEQVSTASAMDVAAAAQPPAEAAAAAVAPAFTTSAPAYLARLAAAFKPRA